MKIQLNRKPKSNKITLECRTPRSHNSVPKQQAFRVLTAPELRQVAGGPSGPPWHK